MGKSPAQEMARKLTATKKKMADERKKTKCKEDLTFGLKNKKGAKQSMNVDRLRSQAAAAGRTKAQILQDEKKKEEQRKRAKLKKLGWTEEELLLGRKVGPQKGFKTLAAGVDPKTVLCGYFKAGKCKQGQKCKFSHDLDVERGHRGKKSLYTDDKERETDTMDTWDQEKLEMVVSQKKTNPNATEIVCKYFLEAVETKKYGWFWKCENEPHCLYQHKLPAGFVLKSDIPDAAVKSAVDIAWEIDKARALLDTSKGTPVTLESFNEWKIKQKAKKAEEEKKDALQKMKKTSKKNKHGSGMSGRALFTFREDLFVDDFDAAADQDYEFEQEEDEKNADTETEDKHWKHTEVKLTEEEFNAALKAKEQEEKEADAPAAEATEKLAELAVSAPEEKPAEPELSEEEEAKKAAKEAKKLERQRKAKEKKAAKEAAKAAKNAKPLTAFEKKKLAEEKQKEEERAARKAALDKSLGH